MKSIKSAFRLGALLLLLAVSACQNHTGSPSGASSQPPPDGSSSGGASSSGGGSSTAPAVASVVISGNDVALAPGTSTTFTAQGLDANGNSLATPFTWQSSDNTVATVSDGTVTAIALGQVQITATANGVTSPPRTVYVNPSGSTEQAVTAAVAAGQITAEQALVYEVWSVFNDPRLPGQFWATTDQPDNINDALLEDAADAFESLSPQAQAEIGPYLIPPAYSAASPAAPGSSGGRRAVEHASTQPQDFGPSQERKQFCGSAKADWKSVDSPHFRVWYNAKTHPEQAAPAADIDGYAETAYTDLNSGLTLTVPLSDAGLWPCDGGDKRLDIYVMENNLGDGLRGQTIVLHDGSDGSTSSVFIEVSPSALNGDLGGTIVHEYTHAIQHAYPNLGLQTYKWAREATANWAVDEVLTSPLDPLTTTFVDDFLRTASQPLFYPNGYCRSGAPCVAANDDRKMYGAYLYFQFLTQKAGLTAVGQFFTNAASSPDPLNALDSTLGGALRSSWQDFALAVWNQEPLDPAQWFPGWDGETEWGQVPHPVILFGFNNDLPKTVQVPNLDPDGNAGYTKVDELSAIYNEYSFSPTVHSVVFYNGFSSRRATQDLELQADVTYTATPAVDVGQQPVVYPATDDQKSGRHIWALKKINGQWMPPEDWTDVTYKAVCLDAAATRIQTLVLIFSNGNFSTTRDGGFDQGAVDSIGSNPSSIVASKTPCWEYQGNIQSAMTYNDGTDNFTFTTTMTGTFDGSLKDLQGADGGVMFLGWAFAPDPSVTLTYSLQGTFNRCSPSRTAVDFGTGDPTGSQFTSLMLQMPASGGQSTPYNYDAYYTSSERGVQYTLQTCTPNELTLPALNPINFTLDFSAFQRVDLDNGLISATNAPSPSYTLGDYTYAQVSNSAKITNTWCLVALRENTTPATGQCAAPAGTNTAPRVKK